MNGTTNSNNGNGGSPQDSRDFLVSLRKWTRDEVNYRPGEVYGKVCAACIHLQSTPDFPQEECFVVEGAGAPAWTCDRFVENTLMKLFVEDIQKAGCDE